MPRPCKSLAASYVERLSDNTRERKPLGRQSHWQPFAFGGMRRALCLVQGALSDPLATDVFGTRMRTMEMMGLTGQMDGKRKTGQACRLRVALGRVVIFVQGRTSAATHTTTMAFSSGATDQSPIWGAAHRQERLISSNWLWLCVNQVENPFGTTGVSWLNTRSGGFDLDHQAFRWV